MPQKEDWKQPSLHTADGVRTNLGLRASNLSPCNYCLCKHNLQC